MDKNSIIKYQGEDLANQRRGGEATSDLLSLSPSLIQRGLRVFLSPPHYFLSLSLHGFWVLQNFQG